MVAWAIAQPKKIDKMDGWKMNWSIIHKVVVWQNFVFYWGWEHLNFLSQILVLQDNVK